MCFDLDSQPPVQPIMGSDAHGELITLTAADGATFAAYHAHADSARYQGAGIVILPDVRGLYQFYQDLALRFAEAGVEAVTIDYFGRTAGLTARDDDFEYMPHVERTTTAQIRADVAAAIARLRSGANAPRAIFTEGFCFGGANSFNQAAAQHGLAGVIGYYGRAMSPGRDGSPAPAERVGEMECPVLGFFGGADPGIPVEQAHAFDAALTQAGVEHEIIVYPGAPHSFFDRKFVEFAKESEDSWKRSLAFIQAHTPQA